MNIHIPAAQTRERRRARAVYGALPSGRSRSASSSARAMRGFMLAEMATLAVLAIGAAGIIALRAWFAIG